MKTGSEHPHHFTDTLNEMSEEQLIIYNEIQNGNNVIVDAIAGSGKSTCILSIAKKLNNIIFLQMTYNSMLRHEIKEKTTIYNIQNMNIHTYHSLAVKYYMLSAHTDTQIRYILYNDVPPRIALPQFHILVIDETQDMSFLYFQFIIKFCKDVGQHIQLFILGDYMQGLYDFKGADIRFLTMAQDIWKHFPLLKKQLFTKCSLKVSYRITHPISNFVNNVMLGQPRLSANRDGEPVVYYKKGRTAAEKFVVHTIFTLLEQGYLPSDIFILGGSVKGMNSAIRKMENAIVERNIPCHVPMFETDKIDERVINGKIVFSTFHSVKGRQRKFVFIMGFDNTYFSYYARNLNKMICPNTLYVGCTRSTHRLYLIESDQYATDRPLEFLKMNHNQMMTQPYILFKGIPKNIFYNKIEEHNTQNAPRVIHHISVSDIIKFIPESVIEYISPIIDRIFVNISGENNINIDIPNIFKTKRGFYEDVSDLNGITIPSMYFDKYFSNNQGVIRKLIELKLTETKQNELLFLKQKINKLPEICSNIHEYLYSSNIFIALQEHLYFKINQIEMDEYNWLDENIISKCFNRMDEIIGEQIKNIANKPFDSNNIHGMEYTILNYADKEKQQKIDDVLKQFFPKGELFKITGRIDLITESCVWELKCTTQITIDHMLQVVMYAWLWRIVIEDIEYLSNIRDFKIFNIKTGEIYQLFATMEELNDIVVSILRGKYETIIIKTDNDFITECKNTIEKYKIV